MKLKNNELNLSINIIFLKVLNSHLSVSQWDSNSLGESGSVIRMDLVNMLEESLLDVSSGTAERSRQVLNDSLSLSLVKHFLPKSSWLLVVGIWMSRSVSCYESGNWIFGPSLGWVLNWAVEGVWLVVWRSTIVSVNNSSTVSNVRSDSCSVRAVNWNLLVVLSESMSVSIWVREKSSLEHLIV